MAAPARYCAGAALHPAGFPRDRDAGADPDRVSALAVGTGVARAGIRPRRVVICRFCALSGFPAPGRWTGAVGGAGRLRHICHSMFPHAGAGRTAVLNGGAGPVLCYGHFVPDLPGAGRALLRPFPVTCAAGGHLASGHCAWLRAWGADWVRVSLARLGDSAGPAAGHRVDDPLRDGFLCP